jgi:hypothetical protein
MSFDNRTKAFLLKVLNEQSGSFGGATTLSPKMTKGSKKPKVEWDPQEQELPEYGTANTGGAYFGAEPPKYGEGQSETNYYTDLLKTGLSGVGATDPEKETSTSPSLGYLAGLGTLKRTMGYDTSPKKGAELIDFNLRDKSGNISPTKVITSLGSRAAKTGLGMAALNIGMGQLGNKLAGKLPYLAALGVDPFDYATKIMGVDYVSDELSKLPYRQYRQITSGGGFQG